MIKIGHILCSGNIYSGSSMKCNNKAFYSYYIYNANAFLSTFIVLGKCPFIIHSYFGTSKTPFCWNNIQ